LGISERREQEKHNMRRNILNAAMQLFIDEGFEQVSIRKIADKIEYSPGTIYRYFKDKDEIFFYLHEEGFDELIKRENAAMNITDPLDRLAKLGEIYITFALEKPEYYDLMFITKSPMRKIKTNVKYNEWGCGLKSYEIVRQTIANCIESGHFNNVDVDVVTLAMWSQVHGLVSLIIRDRLLMVPKENMEYLIQGFIKYLEAKIRGA